MAKKSKLRAPDDVERLKHQFFDSLMKESDRGCVLVGATFLDEALELLLRSRMLTDIHSTRECVEPLLTGTGPLCSFWAKTHLCRALNLLPIWEFEDLNRIRTLRNKLAHSYAAADFDDAEVLAVTSQLQQGTWAVAAIRRADMKHGRFCFSCAVGWLAGTLHLRAGMKGEEIKLNDA